MKCILNKKRSIVVMALLIFSFLLGIIGLQDNGIYNARAEEILQDNDGNNADGNNADGNNADTEQGIPGTPRISLKAGVNNDLIRVTIRKTENASGYRIYLSEGNSKNYRKIKTLRKDGSVSRLYKIKNLTPGKKYYVKVVAYNNNGEKTILGEFSRQKKITLTNDVPGVSDTPTPTPAPISTPVPTKVPTEELPPYPTPKPFVKPDGEHHGLDYFSRDNLPEGYSSQEELSLEMNDYTYKYFKKVAKYYGYEISKKCSAPTRVVELKNYSSFFYSVTFTKEGKTVEIEYECGLADYIRSLSNMAEAFWLGTYTIITPNSRESGICLKSEIDYYLK